ncbi:MAG: sigma-E factor negative regulatory protein [Betaproteobacteria bacterium]|jgi:negative regulator of sigma E activity|nr:sigma-E factor negative regulatory protein [Betaproteobacteria bacterium]|tara:strand:- start:1572 stop:2030 length:459 start_codon:yes stop_codon:yes gene_type:complete
MNEKISSLFDSEINNKEVDTLLSKKNKMLGVRSSMSDYQIISDVMKKNTVLPKNNLTDKIMSAIDKEPTQMGGLTKVNSSNTATISFDMWPVLASLAVLVVIASTAFNIEVNSTSQSQLLAKEDIPQEIISAHHAATANNMNHFVQVGDSAQ